MVEGGRIGDVHHERVRHGEHATSGVRGLRARVEEVAESAGQAPDQLHAGRTNRPCRRPRGSTRKSLPARFSQSHTRPAGSRTATPKPAISPARTGPPRKTTSPISGATLVRGRLSVRRATAPTPTSSGRLAGAGPSSLSPLGPNSATTSPHSETASAGTTNAISRRTESPPRRPTPNATTPVTSNTQPLDAAYTTQRTSGGPSPHPLTDSSAPVSPVKPPLPVQVDTTFRVLGGAHRLT